MSKRSLIDTIEIKSPCSEDWDEMEGDEQVRFCSHCRLPVNNLSAMSRKQALRLLRESNGRLCVRYIKNPRDQQPVFADRLYQITRRAGVAAGVLGASLTLSTMTHAQGSPVLLKREPNYQTEVAADKDSQKDKTETAAAAIAGTVTDPYGAIVPNVAVTLVREGTGESRSVTSDEQGFYEFQNVIPGTYELRFEARGFSHELVRAVTVEEQARVIRDVSLEVAEVVQLMGVVAIVRYSNPLHRAVADGDREAVADLIADGENVNARDKGYSDITPLFVAVANGHTEIAALLLDFGAKVNAKDSGGQTPLMSLDDDAKPELVELLLRHGAKVNVTDEQGDTPLILATGSAPPEVLTILLKAGAKIDAQNRSGRTALMEAAEADNLENLRVLLAAGASVNLKDEEGDTAWDLTSEEEIEKLLESYGAEIEDEEDPD